jgi:hypothetical protein
MHSLLSEQDMIFASLSLAFTILVSVPLWMTRAEKEEPRAAEEKCPAP